ncbi:hypothetical protein PG996_009167 [Apiospora saccharicola]|uniref:Uncharacterized protein n=1 Tax=Apiospora saccharicola TaxID=335842 RepID=A0ABR1UJZ7_9PEZI
MTQRPTYFLAPNFTFRPQTGPIRLGSIIADPLRPHRPLSSLDPSELKARYPHIEQVVEANRALGRNAGRDNALAVWAQFLQSIGPRVSGEKSNNASTEYTSEALTTEYFVEDPSDEEIKQRISDPKTKAVMRGDSFALGGHPVYMITGLKTARGFAVRKELTKSYKVSLEGTATVPVPIGSVDVGASISHGKSKGNSDSWSTEGDIIFAYQLLKIEWKGWKEKRLRVDEFIHKQQFLSTSDEDSSDEGDHTDDDDALVGTEIAAWAVATPDLKAVAEWGLVTIVEDDRVSVTIVQDRN